MNTDLDMTIRRAGVEDAAVLADLGERTFTETFADENTPEDMAAYVAASFNTVRQTAELADPSATILLASVGGVPAGYAKLHAGAVGDGVEGARPVELVRLYVLREWLGRGVGEALMRACVEHAQRAGHETLWLGVWERNARAHAFYRRWGFREVGEKIFQLGSDAQRDIVMERPL